MLNLQVNTMKKYWNICIVYFIFKTAFIQSQIVTQNDLDDIAQRLQIKVDVVENLNDGSQHKFRVTFVNNAGKSLSGIHWKIYFYSFFMVEPTQILSADGLSANPAGYVLPGANLKLLHENGRLFSMTPTQNFVSLAPTARREITFFAQYWAVSKTDIPPNWYIAVHGLLPRIIVSTTGSFVGEFTDKKQWKRMELDKYDPYTPTQRFLRFQTTSSNVERILVLPTPKEIKNYDPNVTLNMSQKSQVTIVPGGLDIQASYLSNKTQFAISGAAVSGNINIYLLLNASISSEEGYTFTIDPSAKLIKITGQKGAGVFYGIQTLLSLLSNGNQLPKLEILDAPRYKYRGMLVDLARNFIPMAAIFKLIDAMSMYKMNKLHLHLTDDEGWRLEIPGLPELTEVGSKRCLSNEQDVCLIPQLGSGSSGSGYLSVQDYTSILRYAKDRYIEIIPEVDMPAHARAAIMAMEARYRKFNGSTGGETYRLILSDDNKSRYLSGQNFNDNVLNPCIPSTYTFIDKVVKEIKIMHENASHPLRTFHFGGNELPSTAWENSTWCNAVKNVPDKLAFWKGKFLEGVYGTMLINNLTMVGWEEAFSFGNGVSFNRSKFGTLEVITNAWDNVWERRAYNYSNAGYKVIMSHATHLFFDHPYEPDPEERGLYWATRFTDTLKTFGFLPDSLYDNIDVTLMGDPISKADVCDVNNYACPSLQKPENIVGMQGQLFSETVFTEENFYYMVFPRLLALAERAWHKASWEGITNKVDRDSMLKKDWDNFAGTLGRKELKRLDDMGIKYRVPPPGARKDGLNITTNSAYPGLTVEYSTDNQISWKSGTVEGLLGSYIHLRTKSADGSRYSRVVKFVIQESTSSAREIQVSITIFVTVFIYISFYFC